MSIFHSQAGASSDPRRECENRYIVWWINKKLFVSNRTVPFDSDPRRECENRYIVWRININLFVSFRTVPFDKKLFVSNRTVPFDILVLNDTYFKFKSLYALQIAHPVHIWILLPKISSKVSIYSSLGEIRWI